MRPRISRSFSVASLALALCWSAIAEAQLDPRFRFGVNRYKPAMFPINYLVSEGGKMLPHLSVAGGVSGNYAFRPLVYGGVNVIKHQVVNLDIMLALGLWNRLELGVALPITFSQLGDDANTSIGGGLGDLRVQVKARAVTAGPFTLSFALPIEFPTGNTEDFLGNPGFQLAPIAILAFDWARAGFSLNAGYRARTSGRTFVGIAPGQTLAIDDEFIASAGVRIGAAKILDIILDGQMALGIRQQDDEERFGEIWAALRFLLPKGFSVTVGAGPGIGGGAGTPAVRAMVSIGYQHLRKRPSDRDRDGIPDERDGCPDEPEDKDGDNDLDGCPDVVPPAKDSDGDGLVDDRDKCPFSAEDRDEFEDADGCPERDNDKDGIPDEDDECPNGPEDHDGFEDKDGCPEDDNDKDGIDDARDACPLKPETKNNYKDDDGCPDTIPIAIKRFTGVIKGITFASGKAIIKASSRSTLAGAIQVLIDYPSMRVRVRGHTDSRGSKKLNTRLSQERAEAVKRYIVAKGVAAHRIETEGVGPNEPIADNTSRAGRAQNRRIEFILVR